MSNHTQPELPLEFPTWRAPQVGDTVRVTGDTADVGHAFPPGTVGVVRAVLSDGGREVYSADLGEFWWVFPADLEIITTAEEASDV